MRLLAFILFVRTATAIIKGISIYGLETPDQDFVCHWAHPVEYYIDRLADLGFNTLRLPFSHEYLHQQKFDKFDRFMDAACRRNMSVVFDLHRIGMAYQEVSPEVHGVTMQHITDCWISLLWRYQNYPNLIGHNAYNEYQGKDIGYLTWYTQYIFDAVENVFPGRFIHFASGYVWSGNIHDFSMEYLPYHDRIIYSVHKYVFSGTGDEDDWEHSFGDDFPPNKIVVGEWGWKQQNPNEVDWACRFINYLRRKGIRNTAFWTVAHSGDTDGIFLDDCNTLDVAKYNLLKTLWEDRPRKLLRGFPGDDEIPLPAIKPVPIDMTNTTSSFTPYD